MKRPFVFILCMVLIVILGVFFFTDIGDKITGKLIVPGSVTCRDTDGGDNPLVYGRVTRTTPDMVTITSRNTDTCISKSQLKEYYCGRISISSTTYNCVCSSGRCIGSYKKATSRYRFW